MPETIYSDNGTTFKRAAKGLQDISKIRNEEKFRASHMPKRIVWNFIIERAPW